MEAWHPKIEYYAPFANGNWETAALQMKIAIAVYCDDRSLFEETVRYAVNGAGNGSITHTVVRPTGQAQESTRAQHYAQLGLGGKHKDYDKISTVSRGSFWPIFERALHHYAGRRSSPAPYTARAVAKIRPEGWNRDHVGFGTLTHWRPRLKPAKASRPPGTPAGLVAHTTEEGIRVTWVRSVDPVSATDARSYTVKRAVMPGGPHQVVASRNSEHSVVDKDVERGRHYYYSVTAANGVGERGDSAELSSGAGLPASWSSRDIGAVGVPGFSEFNGRLFSLEGEGRDIGGTADQFHFAHAPMKGDGAITARIVLPMSSQWSKPGVMMRETLGPGAWCAVTGCPSPRWSEIRHFEQLMTPMKILWVRVLPFGHSMVKIR